MIYDLKLDADGDLILGDQARDADETPLYYTRAMGTGERPQLTTDPEIGSVPVRPLQIVSGESSMLQLVRARLMTENPDWLLYPKVGADLSDLIGKRNTPMTAQLKLSQLTVRVSASMQTTPANSSVTASNSSEGKRRFGQPRTEQI